MTDTYWYALAITALVELVLHWAPWPRPLHRIGAYSVGVAGILLGAALWLIPSGHAAMFAALVLLCAVAGAATGLGYAIDAVRNLIVRTMVSHERHPE